VGQQGRKIPTSRRTERYEQGRAGGNRSKLDLKNAPATGNPNGSITVVEFADFECPVCRNLHEAIRGLLPKYPQVRLVFKDFPIEQIHPWARNSRAGGRCAYEQDPKVFGSCTTSIRQPGPDLRSQRLGQGVTMQPGRIEDRRLQGLHDQPGAAAAVEASIANAKLMDVGSTPTLFVNGGELWS